MNHTQACLSFDQLHRLMECELAAADVAEAEEHLSVCEHCRAMLDRAIGNADWWQEARDSLSHGEGDRPVAGETASVHSDVLALLGPTDDPHMLGRIGTYEIIGILGRGGMGVVFKGFDGALNRYVAIKMLLPHLAASGAARKRFAREAQAAAAVVHDHVMAIHNVSEWQGVPYLVMPYGRGVSLQRRLSDQGPLEVREILRIGMQTAAGLAAAHAQGLVHRDVKPANILLDYGVERVTLTDFGLARAVDDASLTRIGVLAGTPQYMSPEQARAKAVDARSDLFSLGSVLYAMCTGRSPFRADSSYGVLRLITDDEPTPIREINPEIPEWLCMIVSRLMAKRPEERFSSAGEVAELLECCLAHVQQPTAVALPSALSKPSEVSVSKRNKNLFTGVVVMLATLALGLTAVLAWQGTAPPDISGEWAGEDWGSVVLEAKQPGQYEGTFSGSDKDKPATDHRINPNVRVPDGGTVLIRDPKNAIGKGTSGTLHLKWSRVERRFNGAWEEGDERGGKISLRLVDNEIRGAWTTGKNSPKATETPRLADLLWKRSNHTAKNASIEFLVDKELRYRTKANQEWKPVPLAGVSKLLRDGQTIAIRVNENVSYEWVLEIIKIASQRADVTVTVVRKDSEVTVISKPQSAGNSRRGKIRLVDAERKLAWINLGAADSVKPGIMFEVRANTPEDAKDHAPVVKGSVEVTRILDEHLSEVRVLKEDAENKLATNDDVIGFDKAQANNRAGVQKGDANVNLPKQGPEGESHDSLQGVWELALPPDIAAKRSEDQRLRLVFSGEWYGTFRGSQLVSVSRFKVEPQHTPKRLSFVDPITFGEVDGRPMRGIYEVKGDGLRLSLAVETLALPTKFGTEHPEFIRAKGKLSQEQLDALKVHAKEAAATDKARDKADGFLERTGANASPAKPKQARKTPSSPKFDDRVFVYGAEPISGAILEHDLDAKEVVIDVGLKDGIHYGTAFNIAMPDSKEWAGVAKVVEVTGRRCVAIVVSLDQDKAVRSLKGLSAVCTAPKPSATKLVIEMSWGKHVWLTQSLEDKIIREVLEIGGDQVQVLIRQEEQKQYTPQASSLESTLSFHVPEGSLAKAELVGDITSYARNLEYPKITIKNPEAPAPVPPDGATKGIPDASASGLEESKRSGTERMMLDFICQEAYSHVERLKSLEYTFETKDAEGWHSKAEFHADKVRFLIKRQDVTGMWVIDKRLEPMSCSAAFNGLRQQYLDANHRLRLKTGTEGASYTNTTPQQYMFMWLRSGADDLRWDSIQNRELWQRRFAEASYVGAIPKDGRTLEIVDFPQKVDGVKPCVYRVFFARDLGFTPIKYIRRVSATTETSTTMEVTELKTIARDSQEHVLPLALSITESRADGVSLKQRLTITVGEKSLKINEPLDESLFTINPALAKEIYDVDLQDALLKPKE